MLRLPGVKCIRAIDARTVCLAEHLLRVNEKRSRSFGLLVETLHWRALAESL